MTDQVAPPGGPREFGPPPPMPSIVASAVAETTAVLALSRRALAQLLGRL